MSRMGKRKFICFDCQEATFFTTKERQRHFRPKCRWCGSYALDPAPKSMVKNEILRENDNRSNIKESPRMAKVGKRLK